MTAAILPFPERPPSSPKQTEVIPAESRPAYAELCAASAFSFLRGSSHPSQLVAQAKHVGHAAIAVTDRNTLSGVVRAWKQAKQTDIRLVIGSRLAFIDGTPDILVYPTDRLAYGRLTRLLSKAGMGEGVRKGDCPLALPDLLAEAEGLLLAPVAPERPDPEALRKLLDRLQDRSPGDVWLAAAMTHGPADARRLERLAGAAEAAGTPLLAVGDVLYHHPDLRPLQDVMSCIREHTTLREGGPVLQANAERWLKPADEMAHLFRDRPEAVAETLRLVERCDFSLSELKYQYPHEPVPPGKTAQDHLKYLVDQGARWRYGDLVPPKVWAAIDNELELIQKKDFPHYFLTVHDVVQFARGQGILCQGRGSAANSAVCFCLGVTAVDPAEQELLFERFLSDQRDEPPDIDVDFEHERREEVIQYVYRRYGRRRAAICATVIHYRPRSAIREVCKALGLTEDVAAALAGTVWGPWGEAPPPEHIRQSGLDPDNPAIRQAIDLARELINLPRHLSQHVGGFVLTQERLDETVPIVNGAMKDRTFIEWDKDDIDEIGLMKVDVLALGMLTCLKKSLDFVNGYLPPAEQIEDIADIPKDDPETYAMCSRADTLGVFQIESRAQMNMLPRLKPERFYDLVIEVAIVRPGPIQGDMVHPYLKRKQGLEKPDLPGPKPPYDPHELESVLGRTLGVPLFQEQVMQLAIVAAEFTPAESDSLRRSMATFRHVGDMNRYHEKFVGGMVRRGYEPAFAERCFKQIEGFGSYGFPESHAASFAKLVYASAWIKRHHPAAFCAALLNSQPMGFYAPSQIVRDAREHGVEVRPVDVNFSNWDCTLERAEDSAGGQAVRLGVRQVGGASEVWAKSLVERRGAGYADFDALARRSGLTVAQLQRLADADALRSIGLDRRRGLWKVRGLENAAPAPLTADLPDNEPMAALPALAASEQVVIDYQTTRLSLKGHPMEFLRARFEAEGVLSCADVSDLPDRAPLSTAGVVLVRQRPGTGVVCFITIEDETGVANLVVLPPVFEKHRAVIMGSRLMAVRGRIQRAPEGIVHVLAERLYDRSGDLSRLSQPDLFPGAPDLGFLARADEVVRNGPTGGIGLSAKRKSEATASHRHPRDVRIIPPSRDFH